LLDATSRADDGVIANVKAVMNCPYVAEVVLSIIARDGICGKERVENLRGKVGKKAGLGGRIDGEGRVE
jgi:hypothetical protein